MRVVAIILAVLLTGCDSSAQSPGAAAQAVSIDPASACAQRGVAYFRRIGSYPSLKSPPNEGRAAEDVALERCRRNLQAF
jgi:hypothetical protein